MLASKIISIPFTAVRMLWILGILIAIFGVQGCSSPTPDHFGYFAVVEGKLIELKENAPNTAVAAGGLGYTVDSPLPTMLHTHKPEFLVFSQTPVNVNLAPCGHFNSGEGDGKLIPATITPMKTQSGILVKIVPSSPLSPGKYFFYTRYGYADAKVFIIPLIPLTSSTASRVDNYKKMDFGFSNCNVKFGDLYTDVSEIDMMRLATTAGAEGFTYHSKLRYGQLIIGNYPQGCKSPSNQSWPLYLKLK